MRRLAAALSAALLATSACAKSAAQVRSSPGAPRLLIVISVDQLSADLFDEYRPRFTGGLARLARGTVFRNGYQAHAATETCPGHSTILTGTHPARNRIIANNWIDQSITRPDKSVYCAEDERIPLRAGVVAGGPGSYTVSAVHLRAPTLGDVLKQRSPASLNVAVAGKDRAAVMMSGHRADQRWYLHGQTFATDLRTAVPQSVGRANSAIAAALATARGPLELPAFCQPKARAIPVGGRGKLVGAGRFARAAGDLRSFRNSPEHDAAILALSAALIQELRLGADAAPDILAIGLSATDYVGHAYGTNGSEMCLQLASLDRDLGDFFRVLDGQRTDYAVVLTADHGALDIPERLRLMGVTQAVRADQSVAATEIGRQVNRRLGLTGPTLLGDIGGDVYVNRAVPQALRGRVIQEAVALFRAHPLVEAVFTADQLRRTRIPVTPPDRWSLQQRARASFDPARSGDLLVVLRRFVTPIPDTSGGYVATHGSLWDYDRRVPIAFWRPGISSATRNEAVSTVDIMPTLASLLGVRVPGVIDGRCLRGIQGIACARR